MSIREEGHLLVCPLIKSHCLRTDCMFWKMEQCVIVTFMGVNSGIVSSFAAEFGDNGDNPDILSSRYMDSRDPILESWLTKLDVESISKDIVKGIDASRQPLSRIIADHELRRYISDRGFSIHEEYLSPDLLKKYKSLCDCFKTHLDCYMQSESKKRASIKGEAVKKISEHATRHGAKRLTQSDVKALLDLFKIVVDWESERDIWSEANAVLKGLI